ncbi:uncharacterized protein [Onthophagus taurus]|uniref:uncharacterized protein n=1 Tax=Onthophagus taurus TaxID=166361 RepID=UPI0039BE3D44
MFLKWFMISFVLLGSLTVTNCIELKSYISSQGLHGTISFIYHQNKTVILKTDLELTLQYASQTLSWYLMEFPVDYSTIENRCSSEKLGKKLINFDEIFGYLILPDNNTIEIATNKLDLTGIKGLYGKSLLLKNLETNSYACSSITLVDKVLEKTAVARFYTPIAGMVSFRWFSTKNNNKEMLISTDLYRVGDVEKIGKIDVTEHNWKIFVTDILEGHKGRSEENCNMLQLIFDPDNSGNNQTMGDIDLRVGKVKVSGDKKKRYKTLFRDETLTLLPNDLTGVRRRLYLVIFRNKHPDSFLACAKIQYEHPINAKVILQSGGIKGEIKLSQHNLFEPTFIDFNITTARDDIETKLVYSSSIGAYKIHELPLSPSKTFDPYNRLCLTSKFIFNPLKNDINVIPNGYGTQDQYPIGDLSGKLLGRNSEKSLIENSQELLGKYWDTYLPLQGQFSVVNRAFVLYKLEELDKNDMYINNPMQVWICGTITLYDQDFKHLQPMFTAQVLFRYPIVGRIVFRQPSDEPWRDTSIFFDYLVHADGSNLNNSAEHRWAIHDLPPGKDFYDWQNRCMSVGDIYNPFKIDLDKSAPSEGCYLDSMGYCRVGDLSTRLGPLEIAGKKIDSDRITRKYLIDSYLPLTGPHTILGKSFVIYDDHGPKARGERMACSIIGGIYRRKAVARDWFPNGDPLTVKGKIEFYQQTEYDITNIEVDLDGLDDNSGYHIHMTPIEENLEFPCEATTLYGHWNPLMVSPLSSPRTYHGTSDQYEMGDLSGKFGGLDNHTLFKGAYNDTMLPLFGPSSILGRSIVIHKRFDSRRWACTTIERGYSPSEARELRAIASFHHPDGFAYGYLRMTQLIYNDGSASDTVIEVKLRHPGKFDRNITRNHNFAIYVNPVGVDASVKTQNTRCVAAGYVWNPYYTQLADPLNSELYNQECGPENPLRCYVGDLSARLGTIDIGLERKVLVDPNFPLEGVENAMGRSIVILSPNKDSRRYACANIEPDYDIIKYANIEKPPRFVLAQFIDDVREVMGIPEWMLTVDSRKVRTLHNNACVQFLMHFKGPIAGQLEQDFSRLLSIGRLDSPTLYIPGFINTKRKVKLSYKQCGMRDPNEKKAKKNFFSISQGYNMRINNILNIFITITVTKFVIL